LQFFLNEQHKDFRCLFIISQMTTDPQDICIQESINDNDEIVEDSSKIHQGPKGPSSTDVLTMISEILDHCEKEREYLKSRITNLKSIKKYVVQNEKLLKKNKPKPKQPREPTGFACPRQLSEEMITYLRNQADLKELTVIRGKEIPQESVVNITSGCLLARNELTKALCNHIKGSGMQKNPKDKREIYLDEATAKLFHIDSNEFQSSGGKLSEEGEPIVTFFNLQKYLAVHFTK